MTFFLTQTPLIFASGSSIRRRLLNQAGINATFTSANVDEDALRHTAHQNNFSSAQTALFLAEQKAKTAATAYPSDHITIAADQILDLDGRIFSKPRSLEDATQQLCALRGRTHYLQTALVLWQHHNCIWRHVSAPQLTMRVFSDTFLKDYITLEQKEILHCVGGYRFEGPGIHLFEHYNGDYNSVLGLPLLPLLEALRHHAGLDS